MKIKITNRMGHAVLISDTEVVPPKQTIIIDADNISEQLHKAANEGYVFYSIVEENLSANEVPSDTDKYASRRKRTKSKEPEIEQVSEEISSDESSQERSE